MPETSPPPAVPKGIRRAILDMTPSRRVLLLACAATAFAPPLAALGLCLAGRPGLAATFSLLLGAAGLRLCARLARTHLFLPVETLIDALTRFRKGDLSVRCPDVPSRRLSLLGKHLNAFFAQLAADRQQLARVAPLVDIINRNLPGGLMCCSEDFELRFVSDGFLRLLRCPREDFSERYGNSWYNIVHPDDLHPVLEELERQRAVRKDFRLSYRVRLADGGQCWVVDSSRVVPDAHGGKEYVCLLIDNSEQKAAEARRIAVERQYRHALQNVCEMLIQIDLTHDLILFHYENWDDFPRLRTNASYGDCCNAFMHECVHPDDRAAFAAAFGRENLHGAVQGDAPVVTIEYRVKSARGGYRWVSGTLVPLTDEANDAVTAIIYVMDIDERRRREDAAIDKSRRDNLTGLLNREALFDIITHCLEGQGYGRRHSLFMIDLDHFKAINDNLGHAYGDTVLREVADGIRSVFRPTDVLARLGGDEFAVFLDGLDNPTVLARKAEEVVQALRRTYRGPHRAYAITCSVGIAIHPDHGTDVLDLFKSADAAMYAAKQAGRDRYAFAGRGGDSGGPT